MSDWRNIWNEAKNATELLVENRSAGESYFDGMIQKHGGDAMIFYQWALAYEIIGEKVLALEKYKIAKDKFPLPRWKQKAQYGIDRIENELLQENDRDSVEYEKSVQEVEVLDANSSFTVALDAFSKIISKYGKEILASENNQKLKGLVVDLFPYRNELCPMLKQALSCDFTQLFLDSDNNDKQELAIKESVKKIVEETNLEKESAILVVKLITLSLGWDLEKNYEEKPDTSNLPQPKLDEYNSQNSTSQNDQSVTDPNKKIVKKFLMGFVIVAAFFLVLIGWNNKEFLGYRIKAGLGNPEAQNKLGNCYYNGDIVEQDYSRAVYWYEKSAEKGFAMAQSNIGACYYNGYGVEQDYEKAFQWFEKSAEQGSSLAQYHLGSCYFLGNGVDVDLQRGIYWYEKSASQGNKDAQYNLGVCYYRGEGVSKDLEQAFLWFSKSAEQEHAEALNYLGVCYMVGDGVNKDEKLAVLYFKKSAEQESATGQYNLGLYYYNGYGVEKNLEMAFQWIKKSAAQGNARAQCDLGVCYYYGDGVEKNLELAKFWFKKSAEQGYEIAQKNLEELGESW